MFSKKLSYHSEMHFPSSSIKFRHEAGSFPAANPLPAVSMSLNSKLAIPFLPASFFPHPGRFVLYQRVFSFPQRFPPTIFSVVRF
jgi:hypothetical protein